MTPEYLGNSFQQVNAEITNKQDEEIFESFQRGNIAALGTIYDRYGWLVYRLVYRMLNNSQEAEDLTQEIFLSLQMRPNYNPHRSSFYTYLMMLTRSRTIDRLRAKRSQGKFFGDVGKMQDSINKQGSLTPMEIAATNEKIIQIRNALDRLSPNQRQVLELSYYEGLTQAEIAERLDLPLGTVKTHSRRGLIQLRKHLRKVVN